MITLPKIVAVAVGALIIVSISGCSGFGSQPTEWVGKDATSVDYFSWTDSNNKISGTLQEALGSSSASATELVNTSTSKVTGTESNGKITLQIGGSLIGKTITGTINNGSMTLETNSDSGSSNVDFEPGSSHAYNADVAVLEKSMRKQQAAAVKAQQQAQAAAQLSKDQQTLATALASMHSDYTAVQTDMSDLVTATSTLNSDMATVKTDVAAAVASGCQDTPPRPRPATN